MALPPPAALEALLFASGEPVSKKRAAQLLGIEIEQVEQAAQELSVALQTRGLSLISTDQELELRTHPEAASLIQQLRESELSRDLGKAGLEALAIILYRDGATRGEIDWVRGVNSAAAVRSLLMRGLITKHEDTSDKRKVRYMATIDALAHLGVASKEELPRYAEFSTELQTQQAAQEALEASNG
ncbi:SMC-Scp complex subunit ScpB [Patescibacteria group bacterium]|nr:SMC-Scp complex subunit ScpB [Patescibacteria group bacterium]MBU1755091.1 SMC-Scp complex subunit ScpB [Patescibacteria group bacterium]